MSADEPSNRCVTLAPYSAQEHRVLVRQWLAQAHVARWWGDSDEALRFIDDHATDGHAVISIDGTAVGYVCWQHIPPEEAAAAGLAALPAEHIDIDIFIGDRNALGRGVGPAALRLLVEKLEEEGVSSIGLATADDNARALRAYQKAGFHPFADFVEDGQRMHYLRRTRDAPR